MRFYNRAGEPITKDEWIASFENKETKRVAFTDVGEASVSTVWLGLDHSFSDHGAPLIFETMIFGGGEHDEDQWRYSTEEQAVAGHERVVQVLLGNGDLTRPQQAALDAITDRHGRSHVRPLEDGAVEITGLLDDIERERVCVEPDGTERWRS